MASKTAKTNYSEADIRVLRGLQPVQQRPGMYTRTDNPNHIMTEVVDNAQDEALGGYATRIDVTLHPDGSISVEDNGRGIPVGMHPEENKPVVEVVFTHLHAGGKFGGGAGGSTDRAYGVSGGLHGVGVSVTNALSRRLEVTVWREGKEHRMAFEHGDVVEPLRSSPLPKEERGRTGTRVQAWPDPKYFEAGELAASDFERLLLSKAVLLGGVELSWTRPGKAPKVWSFPEGPMQYLREGVGGASEEEGSPWVVEPWYVKLNAPDSEAGEGVEVALGWLHEGVRTIRESYVNLIPTTAGGRHETGLKAGLYEAIRAVAEHTGTVPKNVKLEAEDVWSRLSFVLSVKLLDPQFQNQTKDKMTSARGHAMVSTLIRDAMELWLHDNPDAARSIIEGIVEEAIRRQSASSKTERKRLSGAAVLPGKLSDCESKDVQLTELFLVEGDSAGGSSKNGRDRSRQAILPLRGKLLNTWEVDSDRINNSETIGDIAAAIGIEPHPGKLAEEVDFSRLRYGKIFIMADADVDGRHIQVLLLTLFFRHFPALIERGHIWIAQSPLFRVDAPGKRQGKGKAQPRKIYALDEAELAQIERQLSKEGLQPGQWQVARFKGLGEMNPEQLWETTMNPDSRRALEVTIGDAVAARETFDLMMGGKNAGKRQEWMETEGADVEVDV